MIVFTGGIGENGRAIRAAVCRDLAARHRAGCGRQRNGQRRSADARHEQPYAIMGRADERRNRRGTASEGTFTRLGVCLLRKSLAVCVATQKVDSMVGHKLLIVEPYRVDGQNRERLVSTGRTFVSVDTVGAGQDEFVLIVQGSSARLTPETKNLPVDTVIIGIVDSVHVDIPQRLQPRGREIKPSPQRRTRLSRTLSLRGEGRVRGESSRIMLNPKFNAERIDPPLAPP